MHTLAICLLALVVHATHLQEGLLLAHDRGPASAFLVAGAVVIAGLILEDLVGVTDFDTWPWSVASGIPFSIGLVDLTSTLGGSGWRRARMFAWIAGVGSSIYVLVTLGFTAGDAVGVTLPSQLEGLFLMGALAFLVGVLVASVLTGVETFRGHAGMRVPAVLLIGCGALYVSPLPDLLQEGFLPQWVRPAIALSLAAALLALAFSLRSLDSLASRRGG